MKRILSILVLTLMVNLLYSQQYVDLNPPVIDVSNAPQIGDTIQYVNLFGSDQFDPGQPGEYLIWDLSDVVEFSDSVETYVYLDPSNLPEVPEGTQVAEGLLESPDNYFYFNYGDDNTKWQRTGFYSYSSSSDGDFWLWMDYLSDIKLLTYPLEYQNSGTSTPNYEAAGGYRLISGGNDIIDSANIDNGNYNYSVDAWGVLITPYKTYKNVIRVHSNESFDMHLYIWGTVWENDHFEDDSYFWYSPETKSYVLKYIVSTVQTSNGTQTTRYFAWQKVTPTTVEPDFTVSDTNVISHIDTVSFLNLTSPIALCSYQWEITPNTFEFVDNTDATSRNPKVVFTQPGDYTVTLTATSNQLGTQTITKTDYIHVEAAPQLIASFYAENPVIDVNGIVIFHNTTNYTDGTSWLWQVSPGSQGNHWDFVDFTSNTSFEPHIQFYQSGCYSIRLEATNDQFYNSPDDTIVVNYINVGGGCGDAFNATFTVTDSATGSPISGATVSIQNTGERTTDDNGQAVFSLYNGTYTYTVTADGYNSASGSFTVSDADVNIDVVLSPSSTQILTLNFVRIYPNPSAGTITIDGLDNGILQVYNLSGKLISDFHISGKTTFNLNLPKGVYLLKITSNKGVKTEKLIIE